MRQAAYMLVLMWIISATFGLLGCGSSSDPFLDQIGWDYAITDPIEVKDGDTSRHEIDPTTNDPATMTVILRSNDDVEYDLFIHTLILDIQLNGSSSASAPAIPGGTITGITGDFIPKGGSTLTYNFTLLTAGDKIQYLADTSGEAAVAGFWADYNVTVTAIGSASQSGGNDVSITDGTYFTVMPLATPTPTPTPTPSPTP